MKYLEKLKNDPKVLAELKAIIIKNLDIYLEELQDPENWSYLTPQDVPYYPQADEVLTTFLNAKTLYDHDNFLIDYFNFKLEEAEERSILEFLEKTLLDETQKNIDTMIDCGYSFADEYFKDTEPDWIRESR